MRDLDFGAKKARRVDGFTTEWSEEQLQTPSANGRGRQGCPAKTRPPAFASDATGRCVYLERRP